MHRLVATYFALICLFIFCFIRKRILCVYGLAKCRLKITAQLCLITCQSCLHTVLHTGISPYSSLEWDQTVLQEDDG